MTPNLLPLYAASAALIATICLFARHNRKAGWVKHRSTFVEDLLSLQHEWNEEDRRLQTTPVQSVVTAAPIAAGVDSFGFQLTALQAALGKAASIENAPAPAPANRERTPEFAAY